VIATAKAARILMRTERPRVVNSMFLANVSPPTNATLLLPDGASRLVDVWRQ
jgi:hypothetical protein